MTRAPWLRFYGDAPQTLTYPGGSLYEAVAETAARVPDAVAWDFLGATATYRELIAAINECASAFSSLGLSQGDRILISMPTTPQGVIAFYAANRIGAVAAMIHPLSTAPEITQYLNATGARIAVVLDAFYGTVAAAAPALPLKAIIVARMPDYLSPMKKAAFWLTRGRRIEKIPRDARVRPWAKLLREGRSAPLPPDAPSKDPKKANAPAAILFSGGTTGAPKGIVLSNRNFIAEGMQVAAWGGVRKGDAMLAILPLFHGFGLGVCINAAFMAGGRSILVPSFSPEAVANLIRKKRPSVLVGVPTLFEALAKDPSLATADLSCLRACFSGADTLPRPVKERFEKLVRDRGGRVRLLEGYGLTEVVTAIMAMPLGEYREGSIGIPFPDMLAKICPLESEEEAPVGSEGEICLSGPAVMLGYLDDPEATAQALRTHRDGRVWLHTGDLGKMDTDGFFYFSTRLKRMIKSSGFNVFPAQVETVLCDHPLVQEACVVGVPDPAQVERVKAYVVLRTSAEAGPQTESDLIAHCRERLIKWSCPREVEFRRELPKTRIGKIDYRALVEEHRARSETGKAAE